jgi:hypothetical protein
VREVMQPLKVNVASLGNVVPHLHWHIIPRFEWDSHFPAPFWAAAQRAAPVDRVADLAGIAAEGGGRDGPPAGAAAGLNARPPAFSARRPCGLPPTCGSCRPP